ncbi:hypothetical protein BaRGS_00021402 [Batillaria attramentaria]|uniref:Uncharacterized protein n=1 Tax=Batillaria attramentaria TaxID=370345 RepID=A0ABD0KJB3_9CAEN
MNKKGCWLSRLPVRQNRANNSGPGDNSLSLSRQNLLPASSATDEEAGDKNSPEAARMIAGPQSVVCVIHSALGPPETRKSYVSGKRTCFTIFFHAIQKLSDRNSLIIGLRVGFLSKTGICIRH